MNIEYELIIWYWENITYCHVWKYRVSCNVFLKRTHALQWVVCSQRVNFKVDELRSASICLLEAVKCFYAKGNRDPGKNTIQLPFSCENLFMGNIPRDIWRTCFIVSWISIFVKKGWNYKMLRSSFL